MDSQLNVMLPELDKLKFPIQSEDIIQEKRYENKIYINCVRDVVKAMHIYDMENDFWHGFKLTPIEKY